MKRIMLIMLILCSAALWSDEQLSMNTEGRDSLKISSLDINTVIDGKLASTEITASFYNHTNRVLSGELIVPLTEGAVINGFGLDIGGVMVDGVIVEKDKGRQVFETIQRQGIDPGLLEKVSGNNFRTRVFPLPAKGYRTVKISWVHALPEKQGRLVYQLPLKLDKAVDSFSLHMEVVKARVKPNVVLNGVDRIKEVKVRDSYIVTAEESNVRPRGDLEVFLPRNDKNNLIVEKGEDGYSYFVYFGEAEKSGKSGQKILKPRNFSLFWDASASMSADKNKKAAAFLRELMSVWQNCTVDVYLLRETAEKGGRFHIKKGKADKLIAFLEAASYDGASSLRDLPATAGDSTLSLLVSDGLSNFGNRELKTDGKPVYAVSVGQGADYDYLKALAYTGGGKYINLESVSAEDAVKQLVSPVNEYTVDKKDGRGILEIYPAAQQPVGSAFMISGRFSGSAEFNYRSAGTEAKRIKVTDKDVEEGSLARTFFGMQKLADALLDPDAEKPDIIAIGRTYSLATPTTSFIVLDSVSQYLQYEIEPPKSMPDWRREYFDAVQTKAKQQSEEKKQKINRMLDLWKNKVKWWETEFKYPKNYKHSGDEEKGLEEGEAERNEDTGAMEANGGPLRSASEARPMEMDSIMADEPSAEAFAGAEMKKEKKADKDTNKSAITINAWDPDTPYIAELKKSRDAYAKYLELREKFGDAPSFYLDCGDYLEKQEKPLLAIRIWSNIAEMELDNHQLLRNLGHRLHQAGALKLSEHVFRKVLELRPEEPQSYRDLALVLAEQGQHAEAVELLYKVVVTPWQRFAEIEMIALVEMNNIIAASTRTELAGYKVDPRFIKNLACDVRVILTWDADLTDMDLWVTEPSGEKAYYGNRDTVIGASFSRDFTEGYGPEEYLLKKAMKGKYKIEVNYYSSGALTLSGTVTLQIDVFTDYGTAKQKKESITIRLKDQQETLLVGDIEM